MSNFSQFFPSGGGSGVGGGINSYAPYKVSEVTDNPVGYNVTTGLYTNPIDNSVWLKTGKTVIDSSSTYPNATNTTDNLTLVGSVDTNNRLITIYNSGNNTGQCINQLGAGVCRLQEFSISTLVVSATQTNLDGGGALSRTVAYDPTANAYITFPAVAPHNILRWDTANSTFTTTATPAGVASQIEQSCVIGNNLYFRENSSDLWYMNLTTSAFVGPVALTLAALDMTGVTGMDYDSVNDTVWFSGSDTAALSNVGIFKEFNYTTWVATGRKIKFIQPTGPTGAGAGMTPQGVAFNGDAFYTLTEPIGGQRKPTSYSLTGVTSVGDVTSRTSTMGDTQPLFIKLK